jgi:hypothetical protein
LVATLVCALTLPAAAQPKKKPAPVTPAPLEQKADSKPAKVETTAPEKAEKKKPIKEQNFNFDGLGLNGRSRSPQLLYFLERANEELERASLEKRSFVPKMVKTVEEESL